MYETALAIVAILCGVMELLNVARYRIKTSVMSLRQSGQSTWIWRSNLGRVMRDAGRLRQSHVPEWERR